MAFQRRKHARTLVYLWDDLAGECVRRCLRCCVVCRESTTCHPGALRCHCSPPDRVPDLDCIAAFRSASFAARAGRGAERVPAQHRIGVRVVDGNGEFFDRTTGKKFVPRGYNYVRLARTASPCVDTDVLYHSMFNVGVYDAARTERALSAMQQDGYNTVRVFLNQLCIIASDGALSREYLSNLADLLRRAKMRELFVIISR